MVAVAKAFQLLRYGACRLGVMASWGGDVVPGNGKGEAHYGYDPGAGGRRGSLSRQGESVA